MKKILEYVKDNKLYLLVMLIGSIAFILQMKEVVLYADDFALGIESQQGFGRIIEYFQANYMNWGGGLTCLIATTFLMFNIGVWKVFQCAIVITTVMLATKMITHRSKKNKALVATIIWLCLNILNIWVSRETLYWLDGGLAYEFTAFQIFVYFYYLYTRMHLKISKKYDKILLPIVAFFAGWSSAQSGPLVAVIPTFLIIWQRFIKKEKVSKLYFITTVIGLIGFAIFYFAPGNYSRMGISFEKFANYNIIQKVVYRVEEVYGLIFDISRYQFTSIPFYMILTLLLNGIVGIHAYSQEENKKIKNLVKVLSAIQIGFAIICLGISLKIPYFDRLADIFTNFKNLLYAYGNGSLTLGMFVPYVTATIVMIAVVVEAFLISNKKKDPFIVITITSALIMQLIMVMAPYSPLRTTYYTIMFLWFAIAYFVKYSYENKLSIIMPVLIALTMHTFQLGMIGLIIYLLIAKMCENYKVEIYKFELDMVIGLMLLLAWGNFNHNLEGYKINKEIYNQNIVRIEKFIENKEKGIEETELYLLAPKEEVYGFTPMTGIDWVEDAIKQYFHLGDVTLKTEIIESNE